MNSIPSSPFNKNEWTLLGIALIAFIILLYNL